MRYGSQLESLSVPEWSFYNVDYNSLKHSIKVNTTRDSALVTAIPGHQDTALVKFENELYSELCTQHDRVDLFVSSKADELSRRIQHLSGQIQRLTLRCPGFPGGQVPPRSRRRLARYERELAACGGEIQALPRFINAQVEAFRKILKKYRKWTGSAALGNRFRDSILSHPKSFTRRDFSYLRFQYDGARAALQAAVPVVGSRPLSPTDESESATIRPRGASTGADDEAAPAPARGDDGWDGRGGYWNEYEYGSEAGDMDKAADDVYAVYVDPEEDAGFPGMAALASALGAPLGVVRGWLSRGRGQDPPAAERRPLLTPSTNSSCAGGGHGGSRPTSSGGYFSQTDTETEGRSPRRAGGAGGSRGPSWPTPDGFPAGYEVHHAAALPSVVEQRVARFRARLLLRVTLGAFAASLVLVGVAGVLVAAGRHKLRAEVDAAAAAGAVASLACACAALSTSMSRADNPGWAGRLAAWAAFGVVCVLNGILLVLVAGNVGGI